MVAVAADELAEVLGDEFVERLVAAPARGVPLVEALVPHEDAQFVADVEDAGGGRVVGGPQGVGAHVAHDGELALHGAAVECHAEYAEVGVEVDAVELNALAVEVESVVGRELEAAQAHAADDRVLRALGGERDLESVQGGVRLETPE